MPESFSISRAAFTDAAPDALLEQIQSRTGNESATQSILRSIDRFGTDESILHYEMVPQMQARPRHGTAAAWIVRAVR